MIFMLIRQPKSALMWMFACFLVLKNSSTILRDTLSHE